MEIPSRFALPMGDNQSSPFEQVELGRYWKELIRCGKWKHPLTGVEIDVTPKRMDKWAKTYAAMQGDGVKVHVPAGHTNDPDKNKGYLDAVERRGNAFYGLINIPLEDDAKKIGETIKDVSVLLKRKIEGTTGKGDIKNYGEGIEHVALTPIPVIPNQENFQVAAAKGDEDDIILFAASKVEKARQESEQGKHSAKGDVTMEMKFEDVVVALALDAGKATEDNWLEMAKTKITEMSTAQEALEGERDTEKARADKADAKLKKSDAELAKLSKSVEADEATEKQREALLALPEFQAQVRETEASTQREGERRFDAARTSIKSLKDSGRIDDTIAESLTEIVPVEFDKETYDEHALDVLEGKIDAYKTIPKGAMLPLGDDTGEMFVKLHEQTGADQVKLSAAQEATKEADRRLAELEASKTGIPQQEKK